MQLTLNSLSLNGEPLKYTWPVIGYERKDGCNEIIDLIRYACDEYKIIKKHFNLNEYAINSKFNSFEIMENICKKFNETIVKLKEEKELNEDLWNKRASLDLSRYIIQLIYNKSVVKPERLNHYEPFSPQVYGETSFDLINDMLKHVKLSENDVFVDLGSGVGNVVLQVAMSINCKLCFGIELAECPANYAISMEREFYSYMNWFGKPYSKICLQKGDFLGDYPNNEFNIKELINDAKLIFVNNYAFGAEVDHQLKLRFRDMNEGAFIVSSKPFCPLNFRITSRNLNDIGAMLNISDFAPLYGKVSWTDKPINYYFHRIDRTLLEKYFEQLKNKKFNYKDDNNSSCGNNSDTMTNAKSINKKRNSSSSSTSSVSNNGSSLSSISINADSNVYADMDIFDSEKNYDKKQRKKPKREKSPLKEKKNKHFNKQKMNSNDVNTIESTLDLMHNEALKASNQFSPQNNDYNLKSMTKMKNSNIEIKLLNECSIMDIEEINLREHLGPLVSNDVDNHMKLMKKMLLNYLYSMKTPEYKEFLLKEIQKEKDAKLQLLNKQNQLLNQINSLVKNNVTLLKVRAKELGLQELSSPQELINLAQNILVEHQDLTNKVNSLQQSIDLLQSKNENNKEMTINTLSSTDSDTETASERESDEEKKLLNENRCTSSYSEPIISAQNDDITNIETNEVVLDRPQSTHGYYHPKKTQFKQYMMLNSDNATKEKSITPEKKLTIETSPISPATNDNPSTNYNSTIIPRQLNFGNY